MISVLDLTSAQLAEGLGVEKYRGKQIYEWIRNGADTFSEMVNLPLSIRETLSSGYTFRVFEERHRRVGKDGTVKVLGGFLDECTVEAVLMKYRYGYSACISTQVGCKMGCVFCASAKSGFFRNLSDGEMLAEVYAMTRIAGEKLSNLVLMGMGEPLDNYDYVVRFLRRVSDPLYYGLSLRSVTVSTCGLVEEMQRLAEERLPVTLALSLHNPFQREREEMMPTARRYPVECIMDAARRYFDITGRRVTLEYALVKEKNDSALHAEELVRLVRKRGVSAFHVNLIPLNNHDLTEYRSSSKENVVSFRHILEGRGLNCTVRRELGSDIEAACGQLKNKMER